MDALEERVGLCATCRHARVIPGARSTFYMCARSFDDARFRKYPPLPVIRCIGYQRCVENPPCADSGTGSPSSGD
jgi:hypothetical protein